MQVKIVRLVFIPLAITAIIAIVLIIPISSYKQSQYNIALFIPKSLWEVIFWMYHVKEVTRIAFPDCYKLILFAGVTISICGTYTIFQKPMRWMMRGLRKSFQNMNLVKNNHSKVLENILIVFIAIGSTIVGVEILLRKMDVHTTNSEKSKFGYVSPYVCYRNKWINSPLEHRFYMAPGDEFTQEVKTNSLGFVDKEWSLEKKDSLRIAMIGDSFTQGVGTSIDSSYPRILETLLEDTEIMNFGVSGSDPVFGTKILETEVLPYHPDIVTLTINVSDINDIITRGGPERFQSDGTVLFRKPPSWEWWYQHSRIARLILHAFVRVAPTSLILESEIPAEREKALTIIQSALDRFAAICKQSGVRCVFIFHPGQSEVEQQRLECKRILDYAQGKGYETVNMLSYFKQRGIVSKNASQYFWPIDAHNNTKGYRIFAQSLSDYFSK